MGPNTTVPYGRPRSASADRLFQRSDVRLSAAQHRLQWRDRIELREGQYVVHSRVSVDGCTRHESAGLDALPIACSHASWKTVAAFDPKANSVGAWKAMSASGVRLRPALMTTTTAVDGALAQLGLPDDLGLNPLLETSLGGKRLLVPALSLWLAVAAPSLSVFSSLMHPLDSRFYAVRDPESSAVNLHSTGRIRVVDFSDRDMACLAFWLRDGLQTSTDECLFSAIIDQTQLPAPATRSEFEFAVDGYENDDTIVVRRLGQLRGHQCWPTNWSRVCLINERGNPGAQLFSLPNRMLSGLSIPSA